NRRCGPTSLRRILSREPACGGALRWRFSRVITARLKVGRSRSASALCADSPERPSAAGRTCAPRRAFEPGGLRLTYLYLESIIHLWTQQTVPLGPSGSLRRLPFATSRRPVSVSQARLYGRSFHWPPPGACL